MTKKNSKVVDFKAYTNKHTDIDFIVAVVKNGNKTIKVPVMAETWHVDYCNTISLDDGDHVASWLRDCLTAGYSVDEILLKKDLIKLTNKVKKALENIVFEDDFILDILKNLKA